MRNRQDFYDSLAELQLIQAQIVLELPASQESIREQLHRIWQAQQELDRLYEDALRYSSRYRSTLDFPPRLLTGLILRAYRYAESLKHLAEEFPVDPQGTVACLKQIYRRNTRLNERLKQLEQNLARPKSA